MIEHNEEKYKELLEAVRPHFPDEPVQAYTVVTEMVGPIFNDVLLQLIWRQLQLEVNPHWVTTVPYLVFEGRFNMN